MIQRSWVARAVATMHAVADRCRRREDRTLRDFPPPRGELLAAYRADGQPLTSFMAVYERNRTSDQLHAMREVERIRTTIEYLERNLGGDPRETAALITSLRQALLERAAALEVLRLTRRGYARPLLDQDVVVQCTAYWKPLQRKQWLKGDIRGLYERRVGDLRIILADE